MQNLSELSPAQSATTTIGAELFERDLGRSVDVKAAPMPSAQPEQGVEVPMDQAFETYRLHRRFDRLGRLIGDAKIKKLLGSHVMVVGLGGVGSWAAEALMRSGVGHLTIVDFDDICITNFNRQIHSLTGTVGKKKAEVLAERLRKINPQGEVDVLVEFYNEDTSEKILAQRPDYVVDAIDSVTSKCHLIAECFKREIPVVSSTGSGGRLDPTNIKVSDLSQTTVDPLAKSVRKILRQKYDFPRKGKFGVKAVYSVEEATWPEELKYDNGQGFKCVCPQGANPFFSCDSRNLIMGTAGFVTGTFGLVCAAEVVKDLIR